MSDKTSVRQNIRRLKRVKTWQLILVLVLAVFVAATLLRLNNVGMIERRSAVLGADKAGDEAEITRRLYDLQRYSAEHMNAASGTFYLEQEYKRDSEAIMNAATNTANPNGNIYAKADEVCKPKFGNHYSLGYQQCFLDELAKYPAASTVDDKPKMPDPNLYRQSFASPMWSPDFAGWSIVICIAILLVIVARLVSLAILRAMLKRHYRDI